MTKQKSQHTQTAACDEPVLKDAHRQASSAPATSEIEPDWFEGLSVGAAMMASSQSAGPRPVQARISLRPAGRSLSAADRLRMVAR